ncbi:MAG TPA: amidohydrolase family protein, partial [Bryobacterales bacterium]|nr:amidohydrolase family protein [Bryobacterales bacterium]
MRPTLLTRRSILAAALGAPAVLGRRALLAQGPGASGRSPRPNPMDSILLKDYHPDTSLVVPATQVLKPRFRVIDVHSHVYASSPEQVAEWVRTMDEAGVQTTVILSGATGEKFDRLVELYAKPHPGRFVLFCGVDTANFEAPDYPERAARELERCYRQGARGVGELTDKGGGFNSTAAGGIPKPPPPRDKRLHPDDPRLDLYWKKCAELKITAHLHIADHPSAWRAPDNHQERLPPYQRYNQYGRDVPSYEELLAIRDHTVERHPETTFIMVHFGNQGNDLASLSKVLDRFPNLFVDLSARDYEIGREPFTAPKFLTKYKDRVLFGTDQGRAK